MIRLYATAVSTCSCVTLVFYLFYTVLLRRQPSSVSFFLFSLPPPLKKKMLKDYTPMWFSHLVEWETMRKLRRITEMKGIEKKVLEEVGN